jgi:hypothetical protein
MGYIEGVFNVIAIAIPLCNYGGVTNRQLKDIRLRGMDRPDLPLRSWQHAQIVRSYD